MNERTIEHQLKKAVEASGGLCWGLSALEPRVYLTGYA